MSQEARTKVDLFLTEAGITYSATYRGLTKRDDWECDAWQCALGKHEFPFYTGLGNRSPAPKPMGGGPTPRRGTLMWESLEKQRKPVAPHAADLLHSLLLDSTAADMSFSDWCGDMGLSDDSLKAFDTYRACCETGKTLRQLFTPAQREALSTILQDH